MADVKTDLSYEAAHEADLKFGDTAKGRSWLKDPEEGKKLLDNFEEAEKLKAKNIRDAMTGLYNYGYLIKELETRTKEPNQKLALIWIDMDNFKATNDSLGHEAGSDVIKGVARVVANKIRSNENGLASRYGGDEFVILLPGNMNIEALKQRGEEIRKSISETKFRAGGSNINQTVSIGVGLWDGIESASQFLERVDKAMYKAKDMGRNLVVEAK
jgi:diguanylate cyclase (GGDEF)-like protein